MHPKTFFKRKFAFQCENPYDQAVALLKLGYPQGSPRLHAAGGMEILGVESKDSQGTIVRFLNT